MAIKKSNIYLTDTQNSVQSSIPLVIIYKGIRPEDVDEIDTLPDSEKIFLSTNNPKKRKKGCNIYLVYVSKFDGFSLFNFYEVEYV